MLHSIVAASSASFGITTKKETSTGQSMQLAQRSKEIASVFLGYLCLDSSSQRRSFGSGFGCGHSRGGCVPAATTSKDGHGLNPAISVAPAQDRIARGLAAILRKYYIYIYIYILLLLLLVL